MSEPFYSPGDDLPTEKVDKLVQLHDKDGNNIYPIAIGASAVWTPDYSNQEEENLVQNNTVNVSKTGFMYVFIYTWTTGISAIKLFVNGNVVWRTTNEAVSSISGSHQVSFGFTIPVKAGDVITATPGDSQSLVEAHFIPGKWARVPNAPVISAGGGVTDLPNNLTYFEEDSGQSASPARLNVYSQADVPVGVWIDGKTIYRRVYKTNVTTTGSEVFVDISSWNPDTIVNIGGGLTASVSSTSEFYPVNYNNPVTSGTTAQSFWVKSNIGNKQLNYYSSKTGTATIIVEYTKTS